MNDFRIAVFLSAARHLNFTKAAAELNISQPAISKHINELELQYEVQLFERRRGSIELTRSGELFLGVANEINNKYRELEFEMSLISHQQRGQLRIGASTTAAQYILPAIISKFMNRFPEVELSLVSGNSEQIESLLEDNQIELGIVEGAYQKIEFHYSPLTRDELVLVCSNRKEIEEVGLSELKELPLVLRERGSGTLDVIRHALKERGINLSELNVVIRLGSSEAIKRFVSEGDCYAIVSVAAVLEELKRGELKIVDIKECNLKREFHFVSQIGVKNRLAERFISFATTITKNYLQR